MKIKTAYPIIAVLAGFLIISVISCTKDINNAEEEQEQIANFLKKEDIDIEPTASGLYYIELIEGTGQQAMTGDTVEIYYVGSFLDGRVFDSNLNSSALRFAIGSGAVILGMDEGVSYMREGGEALLVVPSSLGYGPYGSYPIPGYTPLAFEIYLDKVTPGL